ncbi:MAG TPA: DUF2341 domain-containing protein, partial [Ginsengibacter sp.]|nr:DUF2341 domain-containing protein [Ginsengibacter sp.]
MGKFYTFSGNYISRVGLAMLLMLLSFPVFSLQGPGAGWPYERKITLSTPTTMTNYQVRVTLSATTMGNPYTNVRSDGYDLRFYDNNDILCNYWVEKWDNTDTSIIWVKIPSNNCSFLNMYYGNAGAPDGQSIPTNVFDWFDGFDGTALGSMWNTEVSGGGAITVNGGNVTLSKTTATTDYAYLFPKSPGFSPASTSFYLESKFYATEYSRNRFYASDRSGNVTPGVPYRPLGFDYGYYNDASNTGEGYAWYTYMSGDVTKVYINTNYITQWAISDKNDYNWSTLSYPSYNAEDAQAAFFPKDVRYITFGVDYGNMANSSVIDWVRVRKRQPIDPVTTVGVPAQVTITGLSSLSGCKGSILTIKGYYLSGATVAGVTIGGTPVTSIISNDDNEIVVVVGNGTSGKVSVTTPMGTAVSTDDYVVNSGTIPDFFSVTGGGLNCNGGSVSLDGSQTGITYELLRDGASITPAVTLSGTGSPLDFGVQTIEGSYSVLASNGAGTCVTEMDNHAVVAIAPGIKITTGSSTVCLGDAIPLTASLASEDGVSSGISSGLTSSKTIPDNSPAGVQSGIAINFVPANTIITNVIVRFKVTHPNIEDLVINLKGPNGNVINIANHMGGTADNFGNGYDRALIDNLSSLSINMGTHPYTDQFYAPQADGGVQGATVVTNNISNVISLTDLFTGNSGAAANGYWVLSVRDDVAGNSGTLDVFEVRIDFAYTSNPLNVSWSASPDLFLDKNATIPYTSGTFASTVFAKPTATGTVDYSAIAGTNGCVATKSITVNASPDLHLSADYCTPGGGVVRITANAEPSPSPAIDKWIWNTIGATDASYSSYVDVTSPGKYFVAAKSTGVSCVSKAEISVSDNLIPNGNFEAGFTDFVTDYYFTGNPFGVNLNANWINSGFYGKDHTLGNGMGKFLILQAGAIGGVTNKVIWKRAGIPVKPSTRYYYSFWAMSLNNTATDAKLQIQINGTGTWISGTQLNTTITLPQGVNSNDNNGWKQYYGVWESGSSTTSIDLSLVNDEANPKGIGIDDIAFGTLTSFFRLKSANATLNQTICEGTPITDVVFETAGNGAMPTISSGSLPSGVVAYWDGRNFRLSGSPNTAGTYIFTVEAEDCNPAPAFTQSVTINVTAPSNAGTLALGNPMIADCYGSSGTISLTGSLGTLQWQVSNDQVSWTNVGNGNYTNLNNTSYYRVIAQNTAACPKDTSSIVKLAVKNLWTGKSNTLWETGSNWSDNNYPLTSGCDVVIPQLPTARYPLLNSDTVSVGNIEIKPNANVTVMGTALFDIAGNLTSTAGMDATDGTLKFSGTTAQTISGGMFVDTTVKKLIVNNNTGLNVAKSAGENALAITGKIEFATGSAKLYSNGNTVLKSTKSHTANLGQVMNSNQVNGEFTVERYINIGTGTGEHGKAWHVIAPNTSGQTIKQSW